MHNQTFNIIIPIIAVVVGYGLSFLQQLWSQKQQRKDEERRLEESRKDEKWKQEQLRINIFLEKRFKAYSEGLEFIYDIEQNQTEANALEDVLGRWKKWYPLNCVYLPPSVNDDFFKAMNGTTLIIVDMNNRERDRKTWDKFKNDILEAKNMFMDLKNVGWLPEDLK